MEDGFSAETYDGFVIKRKKPELFRYFHVGFGGSIGSDVCSDGKNIYFGACDNKAYAVDAETGKTVWIFEGGGPMISPSLHKNTVLVGSYDKKLYAIDKTKGKELWRFETGDKIFGIPKVYGERVYFCSSDGNLYCLTLEGKEIWRFRTGGDIASSPMMYNSVIYFSSFDDYFYAVNLEGREKWRFRCDGSRFTIHPCSFSKDAIFLSSYRNLHALDYDGREKWRFETGDFISSNIFHDGRVYFASRDGNVYAIDMHGNEIFRVNINCEKAGSSHPVVIKNMLHIGSTDNNLYSLHPETGKILWRFKTSGWVYTAPVLVKNRLYFGSWDCHLYCLTLRGKEVWRYATSSTVQAEVPDEISIEFTIKKSDAGEEKEKEINVKADAGEDVYSVKSEYAFRSEYATESEYR